MNFNRTHPARSTGACRAFTLLELLLVITIIAILAALTIGGFSYAQQAASRNRTRVGLAAIMSGLESYKDKFGEYPAVANPGAQFQFSDTKLFVGGARMLYQALVGNGSDQIAGVPKATASSNTSSMNKAELAAMTANSVVKDLPKAMILCPANTNYYMLVDGFGRPYQYTKGDGTTTVNPTYDLWSYGTSDVASIQSLSNPPSLKEKQDLLRTAPWIKNW